jgi:hypothetical protein
MNNMTTQRELKFKCWDVDKKEWVGEGNAMNLNYSGSANCFLFDNDSYDIPENVIWLQFTGIKDSEDSDVYEDDILKADDGKDYLVEWHQPLNCFLARSFGGDGFLFEKIGKFLVVGNRYENPDLFYY